MKVLRAILAILLGLFVGSVVNMGIISVGPSIIPNPEGFDMTTMEGIKEAMPHMEFKHFVVPFLAHALGTFVGAIIAAAIAQKNKMMYALIIGAFFLIGGVIMAFSVPSPTAFILADLLLAYIPFAYFGGKIGVKFSGKL